MVRQAAGQSPTTAWSTAPLALTRGLVRTASNTVTVESQSGYTTSEDGSGFGLAIVTEVAAAHEWDVQLSESVDGGVRFEFTGT